MLFWNLSISSTKEKPGQLAFHESKAKLAFGFFLGIKLASLGRDVSGSSLRAPSSSFLARAWTLFESWQSEKRRKVENIWFSTNLKCMQNKGLR